MGMKWMLLCLLIFLAGTGVQAEEADPEALAAMSGLPVIAVETRSGEMPGEEDAPALLTRYTQEDGQVHAETLHIEIKVRGSTSKRFPKKSYRVKIVDEKGKKQHAALARELRTDDDWILNPMYTDTSKIRETLAYRIWEMMNSSGEAAASSRVSYAEVYFNGEYWGLYGVQERVDRKQVDGSKAHSVLYKVVANDRPTAEALLNCESETRCGGIELEYAGDRVRDPWAPAASYMAFLQGGENPGGAVLSQANLIDYGLFAMLTQAHDCHFKNQYIHGVYTGQGYVLHKIPWDLNNTMGDVFKRDRESANYTHYAMGALVMDGAFRVLAEEGGSDAQAAIRARWEALRSGPITLENLIQTAHAIHDPLLDAIDRDSRRWPQCGMGEGNAVNIRDIEDFFREMLPRMDAWVASLGQ